MAAVTVSEAVVVEGYGLDLFCGRQGPVIHTLEEIL
jgi:hypothetical protein